MAIFRGGVKIFGSDVRLGIPRDRSLDNVEGDRRLKRTMGGNPESTMGRVISTIAQGEGFAKPNRFVWMNPNVIHDVSTTSESATHSRVTNLGFLNSCFDLNPIGVEYINIFTTH